MVVVGSQGKGNGELVSDGDSFGFARRKHSGDLLYHKVNVLNTTGLCI